MGQIIYVDVLVIINIYINYGLLLLTCFFCKYRANRLKLLLSALFGGIYSLIIAVPQISDFIIGVSRIPALIIMVLLAFGYSNKFQFFKMILSFLGVNFIFIGVMFLLWFFISPDNMYFNSGIVYFNIDTLTLLILSVVSYALIKFIGFITKNKVPAKTVYDLEITIDANKFRCRAFYDTGNNLTDPFSSEGVIIVSYDILKSILSEDIFSDISKCEYKLNLIPVKSVGGTRLLPLMRTDNITVSDYKSTIKLPRALIAVCKEKIHSGEFGALLYNGVFENNNYEKGEENVQFN